MESFVVLSVHLAEECLATSLFLVTRLHMPQAIVVRLHSQAIDVVVLTLETVFEQKPILFGRIFHPG